MDDWVGEFGDTLQGIGAIFQEQPLDGIQLSLTPQYSYGKNHFEGLFNFSSRSSQYLLVESMTSYEPVPVAPHLFNGLLQATFSDANTSVSLSFPEGVNLKVTTFPSPFCNISANLLWNGNFKKPFKKNFENLGVLVLQQPFSYISIQSKLNDFKNPIISGISLNFGNFKHSIGGTLSYQNNQSLIPNEFSFGFSTTLKKTLISSSFSNVHNQERNAFILNTGFKYQSKKHLTYFGLFSNIFHNNFISSQISFGWNRTIKKFNIISSLSTSGLVQSSFSTELKKLGIISISTSMNHFTNDFTFGLKFLFPMKFENHNKNNNDNK